MAVDADVWATGWEQRLPARLHSMGYDSVSEYLESRPGKAYVALAEELGDDVAGVQLSRMQIREVHDEKDFRRLAMDALARELTANLPNGWRSCSDLPQVEVDESAWRHLAAHSPMVAVLTDEAKSERIEFQTSGAYAFWVVQLQSHDPTVETRADAVWNALKALPPPTGWRPSGAGDPLIVRAFEQGWPLSPQNTTGV
jgi:hypothetical protein